MNCANSNMSDPTIGSFNRTFQQGHYSVAALAEGDRETWELLRQGLQLSAADFSKNQVEGRIQFDYLNSDALNAYASRDPVSGDYLIGINIGCVFRLYALMHSLISCTNVLLDWAPSNAERQVNVSLIINGTLDEMIQEQRFASNRDRASLATLLFSLCIEYLFLHEAAHILKGHVGRVLSTSVEQVALGENQDQGTVGLSVEERQALELDADRNAVFWCLELYYNRSSPVLWGNFWNPPPMKIEREELSKLLLIVCAIMVHVMPGIGRGIGAFAFSGHPHNEVRFNGMFNSILQWMGAERSRPLQGWVDEAMGALFEILERHFPTAPFPTAFNRQSRNQLPSMSPELPLRGRGNALIDACRTYRDIWEAHALIPHREVEGPGPHLRPEGSETSGD